MTRFLLACTLVLAACQSLPNSERASAGTTKPMGPANGAGDYKENPGGPPYTPTPGPVVGDPYDKEKPTTSEDECPPKCSADGSWTGCGLKKPRGTDCKGCVPKCKGKGTADEGWYDCNGVMIAQRKCG